MRIVASSNHPAYATSADTTVINLKGFNRQDVATALHGHHYLQEESRDLRHEFYRNIS